MIPAIRDQLTELQALLATLQGHLQDATHAPLMPLARLAVSIDKARSTLGKHECLLAAMLKKGE